MRDSQVTHGIKSYPLEAAIRMEDFLRAIAETKENSPEVKEFAVDLLQRLLGD